MIRISRFAAVLVLAALVALPALARAGGPGTLVAQFSVLGYETAADGSADPSPEFFTVGNRFFLIGHVTAFGQDLEGAVDPVANQYTVVVSGAAFVERTVFSQFIVGGLDNLWRFRIYEDSKTSGTDATLAPGIPTASIPASFTDGIEVLTGLIPSGSVFWSTASQDGRISGSPVDYESGTLAGLIPEGSNVFHECTGAVVANATPVGYSMSSTDLELRYNAGLPARSATWGEVKARYR